MRNSKILAGALALLAFSACSDNTATISGQIAGGADAEIVVKMLDVNSYVAVDTLKTDAEGRFKTKLDVQKGQPAFVYVYHEDDKLASLLLEQGDNVNVKADMSGNWTVEGSEESQKLQDVETAYMQFVNDLYAAQNDNALYQTYVAYYRDRIKYVISNPYSLTVIPVLYQDFDGVPVFAQQTDAFVFKNAVDSLKTVYPGSKYVKALEAEAKSRLNLLEINNRIEAAEQRGYPELVMSDINGKKVSLDDVDAKVKLVYFWSSAVPEHNLFNQEILIPIYNDYHSKGFEIYAVAVDIDKIEWAATVKGQKLPWINVNDGLGNASPALGNFGVQSLPTFYLIEDGVILTRPIQGEKALRAELTKMLR